MEPPHRKSHDINTGYTAGENGTILNLNGQQLLQQEITEPTTTIDLSTLLSNISNEH
jgi:hypothetical protein